MTDEWQPIESADKAPGHRIEVMHCGRPRVAGWGKTSHMPWVGWCLADQGVENFDFIEPQPTKWRPVTASKPGATQ